jgi:hypothetical protein
MVSPPQKGITRVSLEGDPPLPPEAGLNLNLDSYQSDEQGSQVVSWAFPVSFVQPDLTSLPRWERLPPLDQHIWWYLAGVALPAGPGCPATNKEVKILPFKSRTTSPEVLQEGSDTERAPKLSGSKFSKQGGSDSADSSPKVEPR